MGHWAVRHRMEGHLCGLRAGHHAICDHHQHSINRHRVIGGPCSDHQWHNIAGPSSDRCSVIGRPSNDRHFVISGPSHEPSTDRHHVIGRPSQEHQRHNITGGPSTDRQHVFGGLRHDHQHHSITGVTNNECRTCCIGRRTGYAETAAESAECSSEGQGGLCKHVWGVPLLLRGHAALEQRDFPLAVGVLRRGQPLWVRAFLHLQQSGDQRRAGCEHSGCPE
mmetsp:Transcript_7619/g.21110  ORF Transcript_7619/g.21110 Transcript_7619/m.21110 type:complete len:222 (-) Transcript_7619:702-1367(-)